MIQRIQTVYLLFAFCLMAAIVFIPFSASSFNTGFYEGFFAVAALSAIITIFLYKKRKLQLRICYALLFAQVFAYLFFFIFDRHNMSLRELLQQVGITFIFPFITFIFIYLAIKGIKKDDKLVRSLDRLR